MISCMGRVNELEDREAAGTRDFYDGVNGSSYIRNLKNPLESSSYLFKDDFCAEAFSAQTNQLRCKYIPCIVVIPLDCTFDGRD